ncbi:hypothetical protein EZS27_042027 [termite gut metagenome]|uniref:Uncharacterized protein n=1 Tax=termite gut metagenome TaxID=433724 RepID=A0A5J4PA71_9ZZZZ
MAAIMPFILVLGFLSQMREVEVSYGLIAAYGAQRWHIQTASDAGVPLFGDAGFPLVMTRLAHLDIQSGITNYLADIAKQQEAICLTKHGNNG